MPTYEYLCAKCGKFEEIQSIKAPALAACPTCQGPVSRIISGGSGMIFKGSGFYQTDNRTADYRAREKADKVPASAPASTDSTPPSKPADKGGTAATASKPSDAAPAKSAAPVDSGNKSQPGSESKTQ